MRASAVEATAAAVMGEATAAARAGAAAAATAVDMEVDMVVGRPRAVMEVMVAEVTAAATAGARPKGMEEAMVEEVAAASATTTSELD